MVVLGFFLVHIFPRSDWIRTDTKYISRFSPSAGKYGSEKLQIRKFFTQWISCQYYQNVHDIVCVCQVDLSRSKILDKSNEQFGFSHCKGIYNNDEQ